MRFAWVIICLNLPLWVAIPILAFYFQQWDIVKFILYINIGLLVTGLILLRRGRKNV